MRLIMDILWCWRVARKKGLPLKLTFNNNCWMRITFTNFSICGKAIGCSEKYSIHMSLREHYRGNFRQIFLHELRHYNQVVKLKDKYNIKGDQSLEEHLLCEWDANMFSIRACNRLGILYDREWVVKAYESYLPEAILTGKQQLAADESYRAHKEFK